jgi:prephenate dehydrogenase
VSELPPSPPSPPSPVLVVGTGLVGTSVGLALTAAGVDVRLRDADPATATVAAQRGAGSVDGSGPVACVLVAVPPAHVADVVTEALTAHPEAVVTDVGSVKQAPLESLQRTVDAAALSRYVGGHPMAGSEQSGPWYASAELFHGRAWAVTPHPGSAPEAVQLVSDLAQATGATVVRMDPREHDLAVARVSHLPHLLSVLAAAQLDGAPAEHLALSGQGLRDVTRVAGGDPAMWGQILGANRHAVHSLLESVREDLERLIVGLAEAPGEVDTVLRRGLDGTRRIPAKHGGPTRAEAVVVVALPDQPGELARLFTDARQSGVNIEDLRIDHDPGRPVGLVEVVVQAAAADRFVAALAERGWSAHR